MQVQGRGSVHWHHHPSLKPYPRLLEVQVQGRGSVHWHRHPYIAIVCQISGALVGGYWAPLLVERRCKKKKLTKGLGKQLPRDVYLHILGFVGQESMVWALFWRKQFDYWNQHNRACAVCHRKEICFFAPVGKYST